MYVWKSFQSAHLVTKGLQNRNWSLAGQDRNRRALRPRGEIPKKLVGRFFVGFFFFLPSNKAFLWESPLP